ncbi:MAG: diguanylate cyclase [Acidobacteria bacterium]|nr:diguanylate cyclase [Acidobacteriota bacterium]
MTVSVGAAACIPAKGREPEELLEQADRRLYAAKEAGRNAVNTGAAR